jgi:signal peptidase I
LAVVVIAFLYNFCGETAMVPTSSMENTILVGDHYLLFKLPYGPNIPFTHLYLPRFRTIKRGAIVAFRSPSDPEIAFIKRIAAVGGDVIEIHGGTAYLNGQPLKEPYALWRNRGEMAPLRVPAGRLFMLGDNRDQSEDSRYWGPVAEESVIGEPVLIFWSYDAPSREWLDHSVLHQVRFYSSVAVNFFGHTRWSRIGSPL